MEPPGTCFSLSREADDTTCKVQMYPAAKNACVLNFSYVCPEPVLVN
jgi:hypothetical protein